jgi:hypothetical protein
MKEFKLLYFIILVYVILMPKNGHSQVKYISPKPFSLYNNPNTNIIIKFSNYFSSEIDVHNLFVISGQKSGKYDFRYKTKGEMLLLWPKKPFEKGDVVTINLKDSIFQNDGCVIAPFEFLFTISNNNETKPVVTDAKTVKSSFKTKASGIPSGFPRMYFVKNEEPAPGKIFFYNFSSLASDENRFLSIIDNGGVPQFYRQENNIGINFTLQPSGYLSFWNGDGFALMDSSYNVIDTITCGNGYFPDWHEFIHLPDGSSFIFSYDLQTVDMSKIFDGGDGSAEVEGLVIQKLDKGGDVVFQWRSWDHFNILDAIDVDFTLHQFSYVHGNAMELDFDGNLLLSSRMLNEITKIDLTTGNMIWRLGGRNNEFSFVNDPEMFCRQHDIRRIGNGNITLFDNGDCHTTLVSKAKEYKLDLVNKTAELIWEYTHPKMVYVPLMGNVQRLENGNTFINWGMIKVDGDPSITEVNPENEIVFEVYFEENFHLLYRSHRFLWENDVYTSYKEVIKEDYGVKVFPNPARDILNLTIAEFNENSISDIGVYSCTGKFVKGINKPLSNGISFLVDDLANGVYFLKMRIDSKWLTKQFVISK